MLEFVDFVVVFLCGGCNKSTAADENKQHMKNSQFQSAGDGGPAAGVIVGCGVPREGFGMVCTPRFWVE